MTEKQNPVKGGHEFEKVFEELGVEMDLDPGSVINTATNTDVGGSDDLEVVECTVYEPLGSGGRQKALNFKKKFVVDGSQYIFEIRKRPICPSCDTLMAGDELPARLKGRCYVCGIKTCPVCFTKCSACNKIMCQHHSMGYGVHGQPYCAECLKDILIEEDYQRQLQIFEKYIELWEKKADFYLDLESIEREDQRKKEQLRINARKDLLKKRLETEIKLREMEIEHDERLRELDIEERKLDLQEQEQIQNFKLEARKQQLEKRKEELRHKLEKEELDFEKKKFEKEHSLDVRKQSFEEKRFDREQTLKEKESRHDRKMDKKEFELDKKEFELDKKERESQLQRDERMFRYEETEKMLDILERLKKLKEKEDVDVEEEEIVIDAEDLN